MTHEEKECQKIFKIALLVSISCVLQISESLIPHPIPGLRLGLPNVITLIALVNLGFGSALEIAVLRTIVSSCVMGTFMSPVFILSFSAAVVSTMVMGFLFWLAKIPMHNRLGIVGISVMGALSHNMVQLFLAYLLFIRHAGVFVFLPWLAIGAVVMGWITGVTAGSVCLKIKKAEAGESALRLGRTEYPPCNCNYYVPGESFLYRLPSEVKIIGIFVLALAVLIFNNVWFYFRLFLFLGVAALLSKVSLSALFSRMQKFSSLIFAAFLLPLMCDSGKHIVVNLAYIKITSEGIARGGIFALRIMCLIVANALLSRTTPPEEMTKGLIKVLSPLGVLGISGKRTAAIFSLSWMAIPVLWESARIKIKQANFIKEKNPRDLISFLSDMITGLYLEAEPAGALWNYEKIKNNI
jgi:heptaprenyl diphosphate synthase